MFRAGVSKFVNSDLSNFNHTGCRICSWRRSFYGESMYVGKQLVSYERATQLSPLLQAPALLMKMEKNIVQSPQLPMLMTGVRNFNSSSAKAINWFTPRDDTTMWGRALKRLGFTEIPKSILKMSGYLMYMKMADEVNYLQFFQRCHLPDTFASWFIVVELHVWLLSARLMQDGKEGRIVRNSLIKAMWEDNELKSKKLEGALSSARRKELQGLNDQFHASMIAYDEGLLGDDYILAGALWRRFLRLDADPQSLLPEHFDDHEAHHLIAEKVKALEMLLIYVRSQFAMLNKLSREQLLRKRAFTFSPFDEGLYQLVTSVDKSQLSGVTARKTETAKIR